MLVAERTYSGATPASEELILPFELRCKSRLRARLAGGEEIGLFLPPGTVLRGGARVEASDGRIVAVIAADEALLEARCSDRLLLARAAYHLGNRHVAIEVSRSWLRIQPDTVLAAMLAGLGLTVREIRAPFEPEAGAYASGHQHGSVHAKARIHQYGGNPDDCALQASSAARPHDTLTRRSDDDFDAS